MGSRREEQKGHDEIREADRLLRDGAVQLNYQGFIEGDDIGRGLVDVVVTDGFTGNVALKTAEGTARFININTCHSLWPITHEWIVTWIVKAVGLLMVLKNMIIIIILPVNTIRPYVFNIFITGIDASRAILDHAKKKHIFRALLVFTMNADFVVIPCLRPFKCIFVDCLEVKMV